MLAEPELPVIVIVILEKLRSEGSATSDMQIEAEYPVVLSPPLEILDLAHSHAVTSSSCMRVTGMEYRATVYQARSSR